MATITTKSPISNNGIFFQIGSDGWLYCDVHDMAETKQIRFVGEEAAETELTQEDIDAAEAYRAEVDEMFGDE